MSRSITILLVGAGMFGRHYARILSRMGTLPEPEPVTVHRLVLTCTTKKKAIEIAENFRKVPQCQADIIGERVNNEAALAAVLERHRPTLTCIVAKDPTWGNRIHAGYSLQALAAGSRVLCEKPFSEAEGNGDSLSETDQLIPYAASGAFGLELPFAAVRKQMHETLQWETLFPTFRNIHFFWGTQTAIRTDLFNELAPHPWSLIPDFWETEQVRTERTQATAVADGILRHDTLNRKMAFRISLSQKNRFRGLRAGSRSYGFRLAGATVQLIELNISIEAATSMDPHQWPGNVLLEVDNPLRHNIVASILDKPITGARRTTQSQQFLERLQGYRP